MIDAKNIFPQIAAEVRTKLPAANVYAIGSRCRGTSEAGKWDFDIVIPIISIEELRGLRKHLESVFNDTIDENGKKVRIDIFMTSSKDLNELKKSFKNAVLL